MLEGCSDNETAGNSLLVGLAMHMQGSGAWRADWLDRRPAEPPARVDDLAAPPERSNRAQV